MDNRYQPQGIDNTLTLVLTNGKPMAPLKTFRGAIDCVRIIGA